MHPFQQCREYTRALNATKLERVFAKPFLGSLDGHRDGVYRMVKHPQRLSIVLSGSYDGEVCLWGRLTQQVDVSLLTPKVFQIRLWDLPSKKCLTNIQAHEGYVRGLCIEPNNCEWFLSVGDDKCIKQWSLSALSAIDEPMQTIPTKVKLNRQPIFVIYSKPHFLTVIYILYTECIT